MSVTRALSLLSVVGLTLLGPVGARASASGAISAGLPQASPADGPVIGAVAPESVVPLTDEQRIYYRMQRLLDRDFEAMRMHRPGYSFWRHVYSIPDGSVAFGSAQDGRLLGVFATRGTWPRNGRWVEPSLERTFADARIDGRLRERRSRMELLLEPVVGAVVHNETRGEFLRPKAERYGSFLREWGAIYERFGVPAEIGLAQAAVESGFDGRIRSEARALGLCQWLDRNWSRMKQLAHFVIEGYNQTTQAPYCAAYLVILTARYGSFIPALSEHHAGGTNVGRRVINGEWLGAEDIRDQYLLGSRLALDLRALSTRRYRDLVRTYGPRSYRYAEMVFANTETVRGFVADIEQEPIHAMRVTRSVPLEEVAARTGLSVDEIRRFNPALVRQVPRGANLYLPFPVDDFGSDVAFWHRPAHTGFAAVLGEFLDLDPSAQSWEDPSFEPVLSEFQRRFEATGSEEGQVMATVLEYYMDEAYRSRRSAILAEFRASNAIRRLFEQGLEEREEAARRR